MNTTAGDDGPGSPPDALSLALMAELAQVPHGSSVSLPRLGKRLGLGVSVVMRQLSMLGEASLGGVPGPGWVRVTQLDDRWVAALTDAGRHWWAQHPTMHPPPSQDPPA